MADKKDENYDELKNEIARLREEVHRISGSVPAPGSEKRNLGQSLSDYVNDVVESVMSGITSEIQKSVLVDPTGVWFDRHIASVQSKSMTSQEAQRAARLMTAMSSEHRLRILTELLYGGRYASELETVLKDISPSTISNHLKILAREGEKRAFQ